MLTAAPSLTLRFTRTRKLFRLPAVARGCGRWLAALLAGLLALNSPAAERSAPTRPGSGPAVASGPAPSVGLFGKRIGGVDYVTLNDAAARLGLKPRSDNRRRVIMEGTGGWRAEFEADEREALIGGLRIFLGNPVAESGGQLWLSRIDFERCVTPLARPGLGQPPLRRPKIVALDPGHGGRDHGMTNHRLGLNEKTFTLDTSRRLQKLLEAAGYQVVLTRTDDRFVELAQRAAMANIARADLFVSIHFNALYNDTRTSGIEVFTFAPQFQNSSDAWSAGKRPDAEDEPSAVNAFDHWSVVLAQPLHRELLRALEASDRGKKLMHLKVLRPLRCPGVLVECGFLTSEAEARKIANPAYRQKIAEALFAGIQNYSATLESVAGRP